MNIENVPMDGVEYPIETIVTCKNGITTVNFLCVFPDGSKKSLKVTYNSGTEQDLLDNHNIKIEKELEDILYRELKTELFQEIHGVKITDLWERFCKVSSHPSELQEDMKTDTIFRKYVEEFYPDYVKGS